MVNRGVMDSSGKKPLGKILLEQKVVSKRQLEKYLNQQKSSKEKLGSLIDRQEPENHKKILKALSLQYGIPAINLDEVIIPLEILKYVPRAIALKNKILPILDKKDHLFLAMADPENHNVVDEIEFVTGKKVFKYVTLESPIKKIIEECYRLKEAGEKFYRGKSVSDEKFRKFISARGYYEESPADAVKADFPPPQQPSYENGIEITSSKDEIPIEVETVKEDGIRILVVEDEEDILNLISKVLTEKHFKVVTATSGFEALEILKNQQLDLIILDAMLPQIHGFEICKKIKGSAKYGHIPVIMISAIYRGWRFAKDLKESYGVDVFMEKPFKIYELLDNVEKMLKRHSQSPAPTMKEISKEAQKYVAESAKAYKKGNIEEAIENLQKAVSIDPLSERIHYNLALLYGKAGLTYYAISELETVLELQPTMFQAMKNLAILYQEAGFKNKAIEMWERALSSCENEEQKKQIREHLIKLL